MESKIRVAYFSGKSIVPFCASHSSGADSGADNLHSLCQDTVTWGEGMHAASGASSKEIQSWLQNPELYE